MNDLWVVWAGLAASALTAAFFAVTRSFGLSSYSPTTALGCLMLRDPRHPFTETVGLAAHLALGSTVVPALYALVLPWLGGPGWVSGMLIGLLHGGAMIAMLSATVRMNRAVRAGRLPRPGRYGEGWGRHTALVIVAGGVLYGAITGLVLGAARPASDAKTARTSQIQPHHVGAGVPRPLQWAAPG